MVLPLSRVKLSQKWGYPIDSLPRLLQRYRCANTAGYLFRPVSKGKERARTYSSISFRSGAITSRGSVTSCTS